MSTQEFTDALKRPGWLTFAAVVLFAVGIMRAISAIYYFASSHRINDLTLGAFSDNLWLWGIWDAGIAVLALWAGYSLLSGNTLAASSATSGRSAGCPTCGGSSSTTGPSTRRSPVTRRATA